MREPLYKAGDMVKVTIKGYGDEEDMILIV
jgi:hypothetical protein